MSTQSTVYPDTNNPTSRKSSTDGRSAADTIEAAGADLKTRAGELLEHGKHRASEIYESGKARATELKGGFQEGIREKPIQSVLIAAAVGTVIGLLIGRRSS